MRSLILIALASLLAACGGSPESRAVEACAAEIAVKIKDKTFAIDKSDMQAKTVAEGENMFRVQSGITFDPGLPREVKQTFDCKVRLSGDAADVVSLQFIW